MDEAERQAETGEKFCRTFILRTKRFCTVNGLQYREPSVFERGGGGGKYLLLEDFFGIAAKITTGDALTALQAL